MQLGQRQRMHRRLPTDSTDGKTGGKAFPPLTAEVDMWRTSVAGSMPFHGVSSVGGKGIGWWLIRYVVSFKDNASSVCGTSIVFHVLM